MNEIIKKDLYRYVGSDCDKLKIQLRYLLFTPAFRYIYLFRKTQQAKNITSKYFWHFLLRRWMLKTGIQIPYQTRIREGLRIVHFGHIVINPSVEIGKNFNIAQGVLIGNSKGKTEGVPTIGDNVCVNANAIIIGGCKIGNNVLIAPGAFVNFDVPDNSIVIGNPGKIILKNVSPTEKYIVYPVC